MSSVAFDVLVVDDDDLVRSLIVQALQRRPQLRLDQACSKAEALELCKLRPYDLVVSDVRLEAAAAGVELLQAIKKRSPSTAVILLTAYGTLATAVGALRERADNYLLKPLSMAELDASVASALERRSASRGQQTTLRRVINSLQNMVCDRSEPPEPQVEAPKDSSQRYISAGAISLDTFQRRALVDGSALDLTETEWSILQMLMQAGELVVTFEQLVAHTHKLRMPRESARSLLASHIRNLRRKLGPFSCQLKNIRGIGFCLASSHD